MKRKILLMLTLLLILIFLTGCPDRQFIERNKKISQLCDGIELEFQDIVFNRTAEEPYVSFKVINHGETTIYGLLIGYYESNTKYKKISDKNFTLSPNKSIIRMYHMNVKIIEEDEGRSIFGLLPYVKVNKNLYECSYPVGFYEKEGKVIAKKN
jgi:hypothetical protein